MHLLKKECLSKYIKFVFFKKIKNSLELSFVKIGNYINAGFYISRLFSIVIVQLYRSIERVPKG